MTTTVLNIFPVSSRAGHAVLACLLLGIVGCSSSSGGGNDGEGLMPLGLNDTGVDWCGNDDNNNLSCPVSEFPGQDGEFGRDALERQGNLLKFGSGDAGFDFIKLDNDGEELSASANNHACVLDNVTGLMWEVKQTGTGDLRYSGHTYSWYNPDGSVNGGNAGEEDDGTCAGSACDTQAFVAAVNTAELCGYDDWRMPTVSELNSIMHRGATGDVAVDPEFFPNTTADSYWTGQSRATDTANSAWAITFSVPEFSNFAIRTLSKEFSTNHVRLVREIP